MTQRGKATKKPTGGGNPAKEEEVVAEAAGKAGRARTHSRPETRALKSEL